MLIVFLTSRKDYEPFLADVVFVFDGLENFGIISHGLRGEVSHEKAQKTQKIGC
jgi:hypothetical protein